VPSLLFKQFISIISVQETVGLKIGRSSLVADGTDMHTPFFAFRIEMYVCMLIVNEH
jgi:hypothetical protein